MRLQIIVDDLLGNELQDKARELGFSISAYVRYLIKKSLRGTPANQLDLAIEDLKNENVAKVSVENFKKQLEDLR